MQRSSFAWEIKGIDETGYIEGLAAGYGNVDFGGDRILPGAFSKSLDGRAGVPMLLFHDQHRPVGKWAEFEESPDGLIAKGKISTKTRDGGEAYELVKDGALAALSIGYDATKKRMAGKVRELVELFLHEVSLVSIGMNPKALVSGVKEIEDSRNRLAAGERLTEREWEGLLKDSFGLSNSEAERVVRVHNLRAGQGEPDTTERDPLEALFAAMTDAPIICVDENGNQVSFDDL
tara:strand:- start:6994 stop:7695 length:702 start_codon:yes stop_codon:yes gene_type:complete